MSLYYPITGKADSEAFRNTMAALDHALDVTLGSGVISGLTVSGAGLVATGKALIGHVVSLDVATSIAGSLVASTTNYVYLTVPTGTVQSNGEDAGALAVNQTGIAPTSSVLLASIVTGAGASITSVNNSPAGRVQLTLPVAVAAVAWAGVYAPAVTYGPGKIVSYLGASYISVAATTGNAPITGSTVDAHWSLVSAKGDPGGAGPTGSPGAKGDTGGVGPKGDQGIQGVKGDTGATGTAVINPRGLYDNATAYAVDDLVRAEADTGILAGSYICIASSTAHLVSDTLYWSPFALDGEEGPTGPSVLTWRGEYSAATAYAINDSVKVTASNGSVSSYYALVANTAVPVTDGATWATLAKAVAGPTGAKGDDGDQGPTGPAGADGAGASAATTRTLLTLTPASLTFATRGANYRVTCNFSGRGSYMDALLTTRLQLASVPEAVIAPETNSASVQMASWSVWIPDDAPLTGYSVVTDTVAEVAGWGFAAGAGGAPLWTVAQF